MKKLFLTALISLLLCGCSSSGKIRLGCAPKGGVYYSFGIVLSDIARHEGIEISVRETSGSSANLRLLSEGYVQLGIAQSDRISYAYYDKSAPMQGYSAVASLYDEAVMIIVKADSEIQTVDDLENCRISIGEEESGTAINAREVLLAYGLGPENYSTEFMDYSEASKALADGSIAAMFLTAAVDAEMLRKLDEKTQIRILSLDEKILERLGTIYAYFTNVTIPNNLYRGMKEDAKTLGVRSVLLASNDLDEDFVYSLTAILFSHAGEFDTYLSSKLSVSPETALEGLTIPLHPGALEYYNDNGYDTSHLK